MIEDPRSPKVSGRRWTRNSTVFVASLAISLILGPIFAQGLEPIEKAIKMTSQSAYTIHQKYGSSHSITYSTTAPVLQDFWMSCGAGGSPDFGPPNNCIVIPFDGIAGIVELAIPTSLVREFDGVFSAGSIGKVEGSWYQMLAFERVSEDPSFTIIRIELPPNSSPIKIIGSQSGSGSDYIGNAFWMSSSLFFGFLLASHGSIAAAMRLKRHAI